MLSSLVFINEFLFQQQPIKFSTYYTKYFFHKCLQVQTGTSTLVLTVKTAKMNIGVGLPIVTGLPRLYQQCTNRQKQSKDSQNSKNNHWCTNRHWS